MGEAASVMAYASMSGTPKARSTSAIICGGIGADVERRKRNVRRATISGCLRATSSTA